MLILFPLISFFLFWAMAHSTNRTTFAWRHSFLIACLITGISVHVSTELLSLLKLFTPFHLTLFWIFACLIALALLIKKKSWQNLTAPAMTDWTLIDGLLVLCIGLIVFTTGMTAIIAPPNNWDSMTYHMSRVAHWAQNKTVDFYPTSMPRQLWASPWAEYAIAQLYVLLQSDRFANCVQWLSLIGSIIGTSLIAQALGANRRGQLAAALLCASLPMGILEASSTQNDYAVSFWMITSVYFGIQWIRQSGNITLLWLGLALGLSLATKNTSLIFLLPFLIWFVMAKHNQGLKKNILGLILAVALACSINTPQYMRNYHFAGNPLSLSSESKTVTSETLSLAGALSNALRYLGLNLCTSNETANQWVKSTIEHIHHVLRMDIVDPRFTMGEEYKIKQDIHEDNSCNTAHTLLFLITLLAIVFYQRRKLTPEINAYFLSLTVGFFLFCLMLKWQPWGNRLLLPFYILAIPCAATVLNKNFPRLLTGLILLCAALSLPWLTANRSRPLINQEFTIFNKNRNEQYFSNVPGEFFSYQRTAQEIKESGCQNIALIMTQESWEYPLWPLLNFPKNKALRMEHVNITNPSEKFDYPLGEFEPCIAIHDTAKGISSVMINGTPFIKTNQYTYLSIYRKDTDGSLAKNVRQSNFQQFLQNAFAADHLLKQAQTQGTPNQNTLLEYFRLRQLSMDYAEFLDSQELNHIYPELGHAINDLYVQGATLLINGLTEQNQQDINRGQTLLDQWNQWITQNLSKLQYAFQ